MDTRHTEGARAVKMSKREIPYYEDYLSDRLLKKLKSDGRTVEGVEGLVEVGAGGGLESTQSLKFLCELYDLVKTQLNQVLNQRRIDRQFIDQRTKACFELNRSLKIDFLDPRYETIIGHEDGRGRIVMGPKSDFYCRRGGGQPVAPIPKFLDENHVTLFGPPDDAKLSINAMNSYHRKLKNEPAIIEELLSTHKSLPKWGADDEDSKTPLHEDLISAGQNLTSCLDGTISFSDSKKSYNLEKTNLALPIKRFPGLALPCLFLFYHDNPIPLHLYDFALHLFKNWHNPKALAFYVPKLENEEEAAYIRLMIESAESLIQKSNPSYKLGSIRLFIVLENPRAIFRTNEIMDALYPYFAGASLGWHDYLASTARVFKEDANYRIPVKADPNIVIKYIKASHDLLADVVGPRGGIKIGGMYGILPMDTDLWSPSFQITIKGYIKDVITQMKRNLSGFWVAHPDFVRLGLAFVEAWKFYAAGDKAKLETLVTSLLDKKHHKEVLDFINGPDIIGLNVDDQMYARSLIVADIKESSFIANNHPDEIRYNVFQALQYLTDWLSGNGCVALPAQIEGIPVRVMDDLATAERSRWEVWHEIYHKRFSVEQFLKIAHEEMTFIRKDLSNDKKIVQVKYDSRTEKWYPIAFKLMIQLMTSPQPVEFASELLLPFTVSAIRNANDPWSEIMKYEAEKYTLDSYVERFNYYFSICGSLEFAEHLAKNIAIDLVQAEKIIKSFNINQIIAAASFHGDIGESKKTLDEVASREQALVLNESASVKNNLKELGAQYLSKFGFKFLISAKDKPALEILEKLKERLSNTQEQELVNARNALYEISLKRLHSDYNKSLIPKIQSSLLKYKVSGAMISVSSGYGRAQTLCFGDAIKESLKVTPNTYFEIASLSKTLASCFAIEYFKKHNTSLDSSVNQLLSTTSSKFRIKNGDAVTISHLMEHTALNMHFVNGVPANEPMPSISEFLTGNEKYDYPAIEVVNPPGTVFKYSGGGFIVLEHLIESLENKSIIELTTPFFKALGLAQITFDQKTLPGVEYAHGYLESGAVVSGTRKMFPAFAAGAMGTATDMSEFLNHLAKAFQDPKGSGPISHDTAVLMLYGVNKSSRKFMGADMGLGVFTLQAGSNRLMVHQGANDGFRCLFVHCYEGPDCNKGFTALCNAELNGVFFISEVAQSIFEELKFSGIDTQKFKVKFDSKNLKQEEVVNIGYKNLIFEAFEPDLPEKIIKKGPIDPLSKYNLAVDSKIIEVTNQKFARAENLLSLYLPTFDPELFGRQGKIMDSWETVRHNQKPCDELIFELSKPTDIKYASISTQFHLGNQAQFVMIEGLDFRSQEWKILVSKVALDGHALKLIKTENADSVFSRIKVSLFPDGGLTRLGLYNEALPETEKQKFESVDKAKSLIFTDKIAHSARPLTPKYHVTSEIIKTNWGGLNAGDEVDVANLAFGGKVISASNEHYGPAAQIISPFPPLNMFDGFESARSRDKNHFEEVVVELAKPSVIHRIVVDFKYFKNNNPFKLSLHGLSKDSSWSLLVDKASVKAYAGNSIEFKVKVDSIFTQIKLTAWPDGGLNRLRVFSYK